VVWESISASCLDRDSLVPPRLDRNGSLIWIPIVRVCKVFGKV
jgi:hypothetical protein